MARSPSQLQTLLENLTVTEAEPDKKVQVYFQPPSNLSMVYPCIVFHRDFTMVAFADNLPFRRMKRYVLTVIDRDPDGAIADLVAELPMCKHNRFYTADNLNHDVFNLFF